MKSDRIRKNGIYYAAVTAIVLAAVVVLNLIAASLPAGFTVFDVTDAKLYSVGETTKELLGSLRDDVTLNLITQTGMEDKVLLKLLEQYDAESEHVHTVVIDAVAEPTFAAQYTDEQVPLNSVIAVCGSRSRVISNTDIYQYTSYYASSPDYFDGEGQITSAVAGVTGDSGAVVYYTSGHGEFALGAEMTDALKKANVEVKELNLLGSEIPGDCTALIAFAPTQDFTAGEAEKVVNYLENGGHALLVTVPKIWSGSETPVFDTIFGSYGITRSEGVILEGSGNYNQIPYLIVPQVSSSAEAVSGLENKNILAGLAEAAVTEHGGEEDDETFSVLQLLTSSEDSYLKTALDGSLDKEKGDETGPFAAGVAVEQTFSEDSDGTPDVGEAEKEEAGEDEQKATKLLYFTTPCLFSAEALSELIWQSADLPEGNDALFSAAVRYLTDQEVSISVAPKSLSVPQTTVSAGAVALCGNLFMILLPCAVLAGGFAVWFRRRRR